MNNLHISENQAQFQQASDLEAASRGSQQPGPGDGFSYEPYQRAIVNAAAVAINSDPGLQQQQPQPEYARNGENDVHMEDADPYNRSKYPSRPTHHHRLSAQFMDSSAAQRYSPMSMTTSSTQLISTPKAQQGSFPTIRSRLPLHGNHPLGPIVMTDTASLQPQADLIRNTYLPYNGLTWAQIHISKTLVQTYSPQPN